MSVELFGMVIRTSVVVALGWLACAFLVCGLMMFQSKTPAVSVDPTWGRRTMIICLFTWPLALALQLVAWLTDACWWVFNPETGPVAMLARVLGQAARNYRPPHVPDSLHKEAE